jgi:hypothetical protein
MRHSWRTALNLRETAENSLFVTEQSERLQVLSQLAFTASLVNNTRPIRMEDGYNFVTKILRFCDGRHIGPAIRSVIIRTVGLQDIRICKLILIESL